MVRTDERRPSSGVLRIVAASLIAVLLVLSVSPPAGAQDSGESPVGEIIPKPNSGEEPEESGDRGGSLQVGLLGLIAVVITGIGLHIARQAHGVREARLDRAERAAAERAAAQPTSASQADTPSKNPAR